jgi:hypothetical protein
LILPFAFHHYTYLIDGTDLSLRHNSHKKSIWLSVQRNKRNVLGTSTMPVIIEMLRPAEPALPRLQSSSDPCAENLCESRPPDPWISAPLRMMLLLCNKVLLSAYAGTGISHSEVVTLGCQFTKASRCASRASSSVRLVMILRATVLIYDGMWMMQDTTSHTPFKYSIPDRNIFYVSERSCIRRAAVAWILTSIRILTRARGSSFRYLISAQLAPPGPAQLTRLPAWTNPGCGGAGDAAGSRHLDIAAQHRGDYRSGLSHFANVYRRRSVWNLWPSGRAVDMIDAGKKKAAELAEQF